MRQNIFDFLRLHPSLLYAISYIWGISLALQSSMQSSQCFFLVFLPCYFLQRAWLKNVLFFLLGYGLVSSSYCLPQNEEVQAKAHIDIQTVEESHEGFGGFVITGVVKELAGTPYRKIPFRAYKKSPAPLGSFWLEAKIIKKPGYYLLKSSSFPKRSGKQTPSYQKKLQTLLKEKIKDPDAQDFAQTLLTGRRPSKFLNFLFARCGLQHLLVISGFHFSLIASSLSSFFQIFKKPRLSNLFVLFFLSSYLLFLGPTPSVLRSFFSSMLLCLSSSFQKRANALNHLGWSSIFVLLYNPLYLEQASFQLSFLITFSILAFSPKLKTLVAVSLTAIPASLFYFQKFALTGLIYNLFAPALTALGLFLLLLSSLFAFVPLISDPLFACTEYWMKAIIWLIQSWPLKYEIYLRFSDLSQSLFLGYLVILFYAAALHPKKPQRSLFFQFL